VAPGSAGARHDAGGRGEALCGDPGTEPIEHLSDNGSPYTAKETRDFAAALNLVPCFTPVRSPESNGMSEAFVKTFKRDY
jgi:transposase InsO family protein